MQVAEFVFHGVKREGEQLVFSGAAASDLAAPSVVMNVSTLRVDLSNASHQEQVHQSACNPLPYMQCRGSFYSRVANAGSLPGGRRCPNCICEPPL